MGVWDSNCNRLLGTSGRRRDVKVKVVFYMKTIVTSNIEIRNKCVRDTWLFVKRLKENIKDDVHLSPIV